MRSVYMLLPLVAAVFGDEPPPSYVTRPTPPAPGWKFLYNCNVTLGYYLSLGAGPDNTTRLVFPIQGGQFEGPNGLTGKVLAIGAEWSTYNKAKESFVSEAKYHLETLDRAEIMVDARGVSLSDGNAQVYVKFETGSSQYYWLNNAMAIGILQQTKLGYMIDMWQVTSPSY